MTDLSRRRGGGLGLPRRRGGNRWQARNLREPRKRVGQGAVAARRGLLDEPRDDACSLPSDRRTRRSKQGRRWPAVAARGGPECAGDSTVSKTREMRCMRLRAARD